MIVLLFFAVSVLSSCAVTENGYCADEVGLFLCLRAQDRVNWLIEKTNDSSPPLFLNCSRHIFSTDYKYQSKLGLNIFYSIQSNVECYLAMKLFNALVEKYSLKNVLPVECEVIEGSKDYSAATPLFPFFPFHFLLSGFFFSSFWP